MKNYISSTINHNKQNEKQQNLQFKAIKKRSMQRNFRSKSTVSAIIDQYQYIDFGATNYYNVNNNKQNQSYKSNYLTKHKNLQELTSECVNYQKAKNVYSQHLEAQYARRVVKRSPKPDKINQRQRQLRSTDVKSNISSNQSQNIFKQPLFFEKIHENSHGTKSRRKQKKYSNQLKSTQQNYHANQQEYSSNHEFEVKFNPSHYRNKSQSVSLTKCYSNQNLFDKNTERPHNFQKNKILSRLISINIQQSSQKQLSKFKISDFQLGLCLTQDIFGKTYPARHISTGLILCIKQICKNQVVHQLDRFIQWIKLHMFVSNQYIVQIYGLFQQNDKIYVMMQHHCEGNLYFQLKSNQKLPQKDALAYFDNICCAVQVLHNENIVYRNLKPEIISLFNGICKLSNLTWSKRLDQQKLNYIGSIQQCSPQLLQGGKYTKQSDIWALGVLFYQLIVGNPPCHNLSTKKTKQLILQGKFNLKSIQNEKIKTLFTKIFRRDRLNISDLISQIQKIQQEQNLY